MPTTTPPTTVAVALPPTVAPTTAALDPVFVAVGLAQELATALADDDWAAARRVNPDDARSDSSYVDGYRYLDRSTAILVAADRFSGSRYSLLLGLVADESPPQGQRTSLYCVRWDVDLAARTVDQGRGATVTTYPGIYGRNPNEYAAQLQASCPGRV